MNKKNTKNKTILKILTFYKPNNILSLNITYAKK